MSASSRDAGAVSPPPLASVGNGWAVIVGISEYSDHGMSLRFAHRDAEAFHRQLLAGTGGLFAPERVRLLTNDAATQRELTRALRGFLTRAEPNDVVVLYMACHGGPDARQPFGSLYFLTHDTERNDVAGTGVPMDEIDRLLRQLPDRRVVIIADTCHSAGVVGAPGTRDNTPVAEITNNYLNALGQAGSGVALLTSAEANEVSREDERWGGGHGVFTHFLLEGMRGAADGADGPRDGIVSVGELFEYVRRRVSAETDGSQHPSLHTARNARHLPLAVTGSIELEHRTALAERALDIGWLSGERGGFVAAAALAEEASTMARLSGHPTAELDAIRGQSLVAAGRYRDAVSVLAPIADGTGISPQSAPEVSLAHAIALAESGAPGAAAALDGFVARAPEALDAPWAAAWAAWLRRPRADAVHALLIGVAQYEQAGLRLAAPVNDVDDMQGALVELFGADPRRVHRLVDADATAEGARAALARLGDATGAGGLAIVYFGGHAMQQGGFDDPCLLFHDFGERSGWLTPRELTGAFDELPESTLVVLDTHLSHGLESMLASRPSTALVACGVGESAYEAHIDGRQRGAFTHALITAWRGLGPDASVDDVLAAARGSLEATYQQVPLRLGGDGGSIGRNVRFSMHALWRQSRCRELSLDGGLARAARLEASGFPAATWLAGRLRTAAGDGAGAAALLAGLRDATPAATLDRIAAFTAAARFDDALAALAAADAGSAATAGVGAEERAVIQAAIEAAAKAEVSALVVGIEHYPSGSPASAPGAVAEANSFARALTRAGVPAERVVVLLDEEATSAVLDAAIGELAERARRGAALFCLAGVGSSSDGWATLCPYDARQGTTGDLSLRDLAMRLTPDSGVVTILDCGFDGDTRAQASAGAGGAREILGAVDVATLTANLRSAVHVPVVGTVAIHARQPGQGMLARLAATLGAAIRDGTTYRDWAAGDDARGATVHGAVETVVLTPTVAGARLHAALRAVELNPAYSAIEVGRRLLAAREQQGEPAPAERLAVGLAHLALGQRDAALAVLRRADDELGSALESGRAAATGISTMVKAHLGRLFAGGDDPADLERAVAHLRDAHLAEPSDATIGLHLALAMQAQLERRTMRDVAQLYETYLKAGAPAGRATDIRARLEAISRR